MPYQPNGTGLLWVNVTRSGGTVTVKGLAQATEPTAADWSAAPAAYVSSSFTKGGGMVGFNAKQWEAAVGTFRLYSKDGSGNFTVAEQYDPFTVDGSGFANDTLTYDNDGNLTYDGNYAYGYDAWNRLTSVKNAWRSDGTGSGTLLTGSTIASYAYDAANRRVSKAITQGDFSGTYHHYYSGWQLIEERDGSNNLLKQYVWSKARDSYIDQLVQVAVNSDPANASHQSCDRLYYALQDANYNVLGLVDASGVLRERYEYGPYGQRTVFLSPGSNDPGCFAPTVNSQRVVSSSSVTEPYGLCPVGFQGLYHDEEVPGHYYARNREGDGVLGRWMQEEPCGSGTLSVIQSSGSAAGVDSFANSAVVRYVDGSNLYQHEDSDPTDNLDPSGLKPIWQPGHPGWTAPNPIQVFNGQLRDKINNGSCDDKDCTSVTVMVADPGSLTDKIGGLNFGHTGVSVGGGYTDFGPVGGADAGANPFGTPGGPYWSKRYHTLQALNAAIQNGTLRDGNATVWEVTVEVSKEDAARIESSMNSCQSGQTYNFLGLNCTTSVGQALSNAGLIDAYGQTPQIFLNNLRSNFVNTCGSHKGEPATVTKMN